MVEITFRYPDGQRQKVSARPGYSLMEAAIHAGVSGIAAECGGACCCATCHVYVDENWSNRVGAMGPLEQEVVELVVDRRPSSRLSCQIKVLESLDGLEVELPATQKG
ncbi:MAG: 2Fe-2S iron-sulfur cluster-binding protein [Pirellulaceae bacterium]